MSEPKKHSNRLTTVSIPVPERVYRRLKALRLPGESPVDALVRVIERTEPVRNTGAGTPQEKSE